MFKLWLAHKYLRSSGRLTSFTALMAMLGLTIGVGCLIVAMSVVSGFQKTIQNAVINTVGHIIFYRVGGTESIEEMVQKVKKVAPEMVAYTPTRTIRAMLASHGHMNGIQVEGLEPETVTQVLGIEKNIIKGSFNLGHISDTNQEAEPSEVPKALIGKEIAKKFSLEIGDTFKMVIPKPSVKSASKFEPELVDFEVTGIVDFGKYDYNERVVLIHIKKAMQMYKDDFVSGLRLKLKSETQSEEVSTRLNSSFGYPYYARDWSDFNRNFLQAVQMEKTVIFLVLLVMVVAASFNVASTLLVLVLRKYQEIAVLKTMGASQKFLLQIFSVQGLILGIIGTISGVVFGLILCYLITKLPWFGIPGDIYKIDRLPVDVKIKDVIWVSLSSFLVVFLATILPAVRGAVLKPVEGLRYE